MARSSTGKHPATGNHSARPLRLAVGQNEENPASDRLSWRPDLSNIRFADAITTQQQTDTLKAERDALIAKGYDVERTKDRLKIIQEVNPNRDFHAELAQADENLVTIAEMIVAIDKQLDAFGA